MIFESFVRKNGVAWKIFWAHCKARWSSLRTKAQQKWCDRSRGYSLLRCLLRIREFDELVQFSLKVEFRSYIGAILARIFSEVFFCMESQVQTGYRLLLQYMADQRYMVLHELVRKRQKFRYQKWFFQRFLSKNSLWLWWRGEKLRLREDRLKVLKLCCLYGGEYTSLAGWNRRTKRYI